MVTKCAWSKGENLRMRISLYSLPLNFSTKEILPRLLGRAQHVLRTHPGFEFFGAYIAQFQRGLL